MRRAPLLLLALLLGPLRAQPGVPAISGEALPGMDGVDAVVLGLMQKYDSPGAQLAVARHGRLVLAHGYGLADRDAPKLVQPDARFRIASLTKLFTATAILTLVEQGKLDLDAPAFALIPQFAALPGTKPDPRLAKITVRQLLQHTGGWDRDVSGDPMFRPREIASATHTPEPAGAEAIIRYMLGRSLDFDPGTKYAYSNFGYNVLGRIIEKISGQPYADYVQAHVFAPAGITRIALGHSLLAERAPDEVLYYDAPGAKRVKSVFPALTQPVAFPDGGFNLEAMDSHGAWIASTIDYVRFVCSLDGSRAPALLRPESIASLTARPAPPVSVDAAAYYGFGLQVRPVRGAGLGANWWHGGSLPGTITHQVRLANGWTWAAFFNTRPSGKSPMATELDKAINVALGSANPPSSGDLFPKFTARP